MVSVVSVLCLAAGITADLIPHIAPPGSDSTLHLDTGSPYHNARIIHGTNAAKNDHPHQLAVFIDNYFICGASAIANNWAVTAAHCVAFRHVSSIAVAGNFTDFARRENWFYFKVEQVVIIGRAMKSQLPTNVTRSVYSHEDYNKGKGTFPNDIALLKLKNRGNSMTYNIIPVACGEKDFVGVECVTTGWGQNVNGQSTNILQEARGKALSIQQCAQYWGSSVLPSNICMLGDNTGACRGDSGGPLVCDGVLAGVTSWGISECHRQGVVAFPTVFARVSSFCSWINFHCGCLN